MASFTHIDFFLFFPFLFSNPPTWYMSHSLYDDWLHKVNRFGSLQQVAGGRWHVSCNESNWQWSLFHNHSLYYYFPSFFLSKSFVRCNVAPSLLVAGEPPSIVSASVFLSLYVFFSSTRKLWDSLFSTVRVRIPSREHTPLRDCVSPNGFRVTQLADISVTIEFQTFSQLVCRASSSHSC